eukprot:1160471-Pelagomonas_calceolata.AAC.1
MRVCGFGLAQHSMQLLRMRAQPSPILTGMACMCAASSDSRWKPFLCVCGLLQHSMGMVYVPYNT